MLAGLADEHVPSAVVAGLRRKGMDLVTAQERGLNQKDDEHLLAYASNEGRLILSSDQDFFAIHAAWMTSGRSHAGIIYWDQRKRIGLVVRGILQYATQTPPGQAANFMKVL